MIRTIYILLLLSLAIPCNEGYTEIDGYCFHEDDIAVLQTFIDNSYASDIDLGCEDYPSPSCGSPNPYMDAYSNVSIDGEYLNSLSSINNEIVEPLELGYQEWENGRLKGLMCGAFIYCSLSGEIPESISDLTEIEVLRLEVNYFNGEIPESVCELENVNFNDYLSFDFSYNQLCPPYPDCVPDDAVEYMDISECEYYAEGTIDEVFFIPEEPCDFGYSFYPNEEYIELFSALDYENSVPVMNFFNYTQEYEFSITFEITESQCYDMGGPTYMVPAIYIIDYDIGWNQILGDINGDGDLDVLDVVLMVNMILDDEYDEIADMNEDGSLNVLDIVMLVNCVLADSCEAL